MVVVVVVVGGKGAVGKGVAAGVVAVMVVVQMLFLLSLFSKLVGIKSRLLRRRGQYVCGVEGGSNDGGKATEVDKRFL